MNIFRVSVLPGSSVCVLQDTVWLSPSALTAVDGHLIISLSVPSSQYLLSGLRHCAFFELQQHHRHDYNWSHYCRATWLRVAQAFC